LTLLGESSFPNPKSPVRWAHSAAHPAEAARIANAMCVHFIVKLGGGDYLDGESAHLVAVRPARAGLVRRAFRVRRSRQVPLFRERLYFG